MTDEQTTGNTDGTEDKPKRTRRAPDKPFKIMMQPTGKLPDELKELQDRLWVEVPAEKKIESAADAWAMIENDKSFAAGKYKVIQDCGDRTKNVTTETITKATLS